MTLLQTAEAIGLELASRLASITVANGAETDIGTSVYRGRRDIDEDLIPCAVLIEAPDTVDEMRVGTKAEISQQYVLFGYVPCDPANPNDAAHKVLRDLKRAVFRTDGKPSANLGGKVRRVKYLGRDIGPRSDGAAFVLATIEIAVEYAEDLASP